MKTLTTLTVAILLLSYLSFAQEKTSSFEVGINLGAGLYAGDLTPTFFSPYKSPGLFIGFSGGKKLNRTLTLQADLSFGKVKADDANYADPAYRRLRNYNFKTRITELTASLVLNPLGRERRITPWFSAGAGLSLVKIKRDYSELDMEYFSNDEAITVGLAEDIEHRLPRLLPVVPLATGIRYSLNNKISLNLQTSYRLMLSDYLDGFSKGANPSKKDHYYTHTLGLVYSFGQKNNLACPK